MILFQSDYLEGALPEVLEALSRTNLEQTPGYGHDDYCAKAAGIVRRICGAPKAEVHFMVGGTQTNKTVIASILKPYQGVMCADTGHISVHETGAIEQSGHKVLVLPSKDGRISADAVDAAMEAHFAEGAPEHCVQPGMVYISFPTELGTLYSKKELRDLRKVCSKWRLPLYIDGARLGYGLASEGCDVALKDIAQIADVFYIGGTKQGALFGEAVVICNDALAEGFRYNVKQQGGLLAKGRLLGLQFLALLGGDLYMSTSRRADRLAERIAGAFRAQGCAFLVEPASNLVFPVMPEKVAAAISKDFAFDIWAVDRSAHTVTGRFCTSWATSEENVDSLVESIGKAFVK